jgi:hypothetical protein
MDVLVALLVPRNLHNFILNVFGEAFFQGLGDHCDFVFLVGRLGKAL